MEYNHNHGMCSGTECQQFISRGDDYRTTGLCRLTGRECGARIAGGASICRAYSADIRRQAHSEHPEYDPPGSGWKAEHREWLTAKLSWLRRAYDNTGKPEKEARYAEAIRHLTAALVALDGGHERPWMFRGTPILYGKPAPHTAVQETERTNAGHSVMADLYHGPTPEDRAEFADEPSSAMKTAVEKPEDPNAE